MQGPSPSTHPRADVPRSSGSHMGARWQLGPIDNPVGCGRRLAADGRPCVQLMRRRAGICFTKLAANQPDFKGDEAGNRDAGPAGAAICRSTRTGEPTARAATPAHKKPSAPAWKPTAQLPAPAEMSAEEARPALMATARLRVIR